MNETMTMEMIQRVEDDPEYRSAAAELAVLHAQQQAQIERREQLATVLAHQQNQHVKIPPALRVIDPRDAAKELTSVNRQLEQIARDIEAQQRAVNEAAGAASARASELARDGYRKCVAKVSQLRRDLAAAEAERRQYLAALEKLGVSVGRLIAEEGTG